jgi:hypothetical protein
MELARQARNLGTEIEGFLIGIVQAVVAGAILASLQKLGKLLAIRLSYPWELLQVKVLLRATKEAFLLSMLYPALKDSRKLSPLFPIARFYLRGYQRLIWTIASTPTIKKSLTDVSHRNLGAKGEPLITATRSAEALAEEFSTIETDASWLTTFIFSGMFQVASKSIVEPNAGHDLALAHMKELLAS